MSNVILPIAIWAAIGLAGLSILVMGLSGLRSVWFGKVQPRTIAIVSLPGVLVVVLRIAMETWVQAGIYTLVVMFFLLLLGMVITGVRKLMQGAVI